MSLFADTAKQRESNSRLDIQVSVDTGRHGPDDLVDNIGIPGQGTDFALVFFRQVETSQLIVGLDDMVGFENSGKHREPVLVVELRVVAITVNACDFDLVTRFGGINQISK